MRYRTEEDSLGKVKVPSNKLWGAQTERSRKNFSISSEKIPLEFIYAHALIKKAAANANYKLKLLSKIKRDLIISAADEILASKHDKEFPLSVWQTGSGTQTNMNVNEVIANIAIKKAGGELGSKKPIHPNDDVNMSQSTNDTFPTSIHISSSLLIYHKLLPALYSLESTLSAKEKAFSKIIKVGRTHIMDAVPISLGQEFSGYRAELKRIIQKIEDTLKDLSELAIGGSAVGTGINTHPRYRKLVVEEIKKLTKYPFQEATNSFEAISSKDSCSLMSALFKQLANFFIKMGNDLKIGSSGPRAGINELILPANEPGSSIMPGKVNPTQIEALLMVSSAVIGNDLTIELSAMQGQFQLNAFMPVIAYKMIESIRLLTDAVESFIKHCLKGIRPNKKVIEKHLQENLILATALNKKLGYDLASKIVKKAYTENKSLKRAALELKALSSREFDQIVNPKKMIFPSE